MKCEEIAVFSQRLLLNTIEFHLNLIRNLNWIRYRFLLSRSLRLCNFFTFLYCIMPNLYRNTLLLIVINLHSIQYLTFHAKSIFFTLYDTYWILVIYTLRLIIKNKFLFVKSLKYIYVNNNKLNLHNVI